jgi:uncharacterized protein (TIGR03437 family)
VEKTITVTSTGAALPFTVTSDVPWLSFRPASGTASPGNPVSIVVTADPSAIGSAAKAGSILIRQAAGREQPVAVSVAAKPAATERPVITAVVNGASFEGPGIAPGTWVTIKGTGLCNISGGREWSRADIPDGRLPTSLEGVSVSINGVPAYVRYVSAGQLNVLAPGDSARGEVAVVVTNNGKVSAPVAAQLQPVSPAFFQFDKYAIAQRHPDLALLGNPALASVFTPVRPGDVVILWAAGLGPTAPAGREGMEPAGGAAVIGTPTVSVGGKVIPPSHFVGAAISEYAGGYQVAIRVPEDVEEGDVPITMSAGNFSSPQGVFLYVKK